MRRVTQDAGHTLCFHSRYSRADAGMSKPAVVIVHRALTAGLLGAMLAKARGSRHKTSIDPLRNKMMRWKRYKLGR